MTLSSLASCLFLPRVRATGVRRKAGQTSHSFGVCREVRRWKIEMVCRVLRPPLPAPQSWLFADAKKPSAELGINHLVNEKQAEVWET